MKMCKKKHLTGRRGVTARLWLVVAMALFSGMCEGYTNASPVDDAKAIIRFYLLEMLSLSPLGSQDWWRWLRVAPGSFEAAQLSVSGTCARSRVPVTSGWLGS